MMLSSFVLSWFKRKQHTGLEKLKFACKISRDIRVCLGTRCVHCYFLHTKITYMYACTQSVFVMVKFINAHNLHFTLKIFPSSLLPYFYKILHNYFAPICIYIILHSKVISRDTHAFFMC